MAHWYHKDKAARPFGARIADAVANGMGSWTFIIIQTMLVAAWMILNIVAYVSHWDPYPFILLNLLFSTQAAYAAPIIMMAQNRQAERDRHQADADYQTNVEAKKEIETLQQHLSRLEIEKLDSILIKLEDTNKILNSYADQQRKTRKKTRTPTL